MAYTLTLVCGCKVLVFGNLGSAAPPVRVITSLGNRCTSRGHVVGRRIHVWELLPEPCPRARAVLVSNGERLTRA